MAKITYKILLIIIPFIISSCVEIEDFFSEYKGETVKVQIKINVNKENDLGDKDIKINSKAPNNINEDLVSDIWVIQFNGTTTSSTKVYTKYINVTTSTLGLSFAASSSTNRIVIIANTHNSGFDWSMVTTYQDLLDKMQTVTTEDNLYGGAGNLGILMSGYTDVIVNNITSYPPLQIDLTRSVAKVEFNLVLNSSCGVTIDSIMLCDIPSEFHIADKLKSIHNTLPTLYPSHINTSFTSFKITSDMPVAGGSVKTYNWYLPRNQKGTNSSTTEKDKNDVVPYSSSYIKVCGKRTSDSKKVYFNIYPGANMTNDFNIIPNSKYNISIRLNSVADFSVDTRVEDSVVTDYTKLSYSNCYILNPPPTGMTRYYRIPVGRVDEYWGSSQTGYGNTPGNLLSTSNTWTISLLWQDTLNLVQSSGTSNITLTKTTGLGKNDYFEIAVPSTAKDGNFVISIALNSSPSTILWSWHFWVTDYNPYYTGTITTGSINQKYAVPSGSVHRYADVSGTNIWKSGYELQNSYALDRNIGQLTETYTPVNTKHGTLYYQFGRKDPFPANIYLYNINGTKVTYSTSANYSNTNVAMSKTVNNPLTFYAGISGPTAITYLWNDPNVLTSSTAKSIYDPSPWGFKLPKTGVWSNFSNSTFPWTTNTRLYNVSSINAYYYADGFRKSGGGTLSNVASRGYYWNSSPSSAANAYNMTFRNTSVTSDATVAKANGYVCRPVRE
ncbi:MAG: hypothetical protein VB011_04765 [Bacteroidales bacterium]|nr:hypothetical protein [Bacteroidales bacterium]